MQNMPPRFAPPPRRVPLSLTLTNVFGGFAQIGWFVFGFGMIFFWAFVGNADFSFISFRGDLARAAGRVTRTSETGASEGKVGIVKNHYEYSVAGEWLEGDSYSVGRSVAEGDKVMVEYKPGDPKSSRIEGMRRAQFPAGVAFVMIFPLIGLAFVYFATRTGLKRNALLRDGVLTTGELKSTEPTNMTINKRRVFALTFEFKSADGRVHEAVAKTTDTQRLEDEPREPLLYDPNDPTRAFVLDEAPARPQLDETGELRGRPIAALLAVVIPLLVVAGHGLVLLIKLRVLHF